LSSFDVCWFGDPDKAVDHGFIFGPEWEEHLHSSEEWTVYSQVEAFSEGRIWLSRGEPPQFAEDIYMSGDKFYAYVEPVAAAALLPFYKVGQLFGDGWLIRSVLVGMIFYTCLAALLVREISFQLTSNRKLAVFAALLFAFCTMAFSYSRLLYPQPIVCLLALATSLFLFRYRKSRNSKDLLCSAAFYSFTVLSFNTFLITLPIFAYFLYRTGFKIDKKNIASLLSGILPFAAAFLLWNVFTTGNPLLTNRQCIYPSLTFQVLYPTPNGVWFNVEGLFGQLFSPAGIFFVSPILFASLFGFFALKQKAKEETVLLALLAVAFWLFISFAAHPGDATGRDFWIGGWASTARYMYLPSAIVAIFASSTFETVHKNRRLIAAWLLSLMTIISFLANMSYGIHHDLMAGKSEEFISKSLIIWPYHLASTELTAFTIAIPLISLAYPIFLATKEKKTLELIRQAFKKAIHDKR